MSGEFHGYEQKGFYLHDWIGPSESSLLLGAGADYLLEILILTEIPEIDITYLSCGLLAGNSFLPSPSDTT